MSFILQTEIVLIPFFMPLTGISYPVELANTSNTMLNNSRDSR